MTQPTSGTPRPPHVVLLVANDATSDVRVLKYAASLVQFGLQVTILALTTADEQAETVVAGARLVQVPVRSRIRDYRARHGIRGLTRAVRPGYPTRDDAANAKLRWSLASRELMAARGRDALDTGEADGTPRAPEVATRIRRAVWWRGLRAWRFVIYVREGLLNRRQRRKGLVHGELRERLIGLYRSVPLLASWRRVLPELDDDELALGWLIDDLAPDVLHPHDVYLLGVAERAVARAALTGRRVRLVYDAREYVAGLAIPPARTVAAYADLEREFIGRADRVITVADPIADELVRAYHLRRRPDLVLNAPVVGQPPPGAEPPSVRASAGVGPDTPLLVYSGGLAAPRGVHTVVEALPSLPDVHLAVVSRMASSYTIALERLAARLGVADRMHIVGFVAPDQVVAYLSTATAGVIPLLHAGNHDWALTNKFFEYLHAGLPIITSDTEVQVRLVTELGLGEVFTAGDAANLTQVVRRVLADPDRYRAALTDPQLRERFSWDAQARVLHAVYTELLGALPHPAGHVASLAAPAPVHVARDPDHPVLGVGPTNSAGQGYAWAKALERAWPQVSTEVYSLDHGSVFDFPADLVIPGERWRSADWQLARMAYVRGRFSHLVLESGLGAFGTLHGGYTGGDLPVLREAGIALALAFHGSEVRSPVRHAELEPTSPFRPGAGLDPGYVRRIQDSCDRNAELVVRFTAEAGGPVYVSSLDLLDYVPGARWLPVVVDPQVWAPGPRVLERDRPVVVHIPSNPLLKGSALIDPVLTELDRRGVIEYRRGAQVPSSAMPDLVREADILVDQLTLGLYGVQAAQAMSAGRLVLSYVGDAIRTRLAAYDAELPIVEVAPDTLAEQLLAVLADRDRARSVAEEGTRFASRFHDGTMAAGILAEFVGLAPGRSQ